MKTNMQDFCQEFSKELEPFGEELRLALSELPARADLKQIDTSVLGLQEVQQRLSTLREKVSDQSTFLLIFGPLKSGKSTLMNALSGAYVSEVSSLPAYPALVYVKNGEQRRFVATDYVGGTREFPDTLALADAVKADHTFLADAIVEAENKDEGFDPQQHYPQAIRRMDIVVPAINLAESGSVLVDTPGLYSRMKFGYDQMTRDFRDTAACAIFVVKTDNLFFEKVFEEFEELLSCFSRIFLVANIDSSKQDLRPDGTLEPSLESSDPQKIIDSFRSLSMSATLRGAIEDGRLKIYPIDLQAAASKILQENAATTPVAEEAGTDVSAPSNDGFDEFVTDLTGYLNSSDYLHDFKFDSLRLARDLTAETNDLVSGDASTQLSNTKRQAQEDLERERTRLESLKTLEQQNWDKAFNTLLGTKDNPLGELTEQNTEHLESSCQEQVSAWMESDESWNELLERLNPQLQQESNRQTELLLQHLRKQLEGGFAGAEFSQAQLAAFRDGGLQVKVVLAACLQNLGAQTQTDTPTLELSIEEIPVARTFVDYLLFRSHRRVWQNIFGEDGNRSVNAADKKKRLGEPSLEKLRAIARDTVAKEMPALQQRYAAELIDAHVKQCIQTLQQSITGLRTGLQKSTAPMEAALKQVQMTQEIFERIQSSCTRFNEELSQLQSEFDLDHATGDDNTVEYLDLDMDLVEEEDEELADDLAFLPKSSLV